MARTKDATAWTQDEDLALVEIVLRYIRTGKMIKDAYAEAEKLIPGRSAGACKNQWVGRLSKIYDSSIEQAKLQRMAHEEKLTLFDTENTEKESFENGGVAVAPEIKLPQNVSINNTSAVGAAMQKAMEGTKEKRVGKFNLPEMTLLTEEEKAQAELPVTTGIQQEIDFEKNVITDAKEEKPLDNPFLRIRKFVAKMEKEHGNILEENAQLKRDMEYLQVQLREKDNELVDLQSELDNTREQLNQANEQLDTFAEIKELIKQFNTIEE